MNASYFCQFIGSVYKHKVLELPLFKHKMLAVLYLIIIHLSYIAVSFVRHSLTLVTSEPEKLHGVVFFKLHVRTHDSLRKCPTYLWLCTHNHGRVKSLQKNAVLSYNGLPRRAVFIKGGLGRLRTVFWSTSIQAYIMVGLEKQIQEITCCKCLLLLLLLGSEGNA